MGTHETNDVKFPCTHAIFQLIHYYAVATYMHDADVMHCGGFL